MDTDTTEPTPDELDTPFARTLRHRLEAEVPELPAGPGPARAIVRAQARRRNRRAALATVAAGALVVATVQVLPDDGGRTAVDTASADVRLDPTLQLDWTVTDDGLAWATAHAPGSAGLYALSTAPGTRAEDFPRGDAPRAMYRLDDDGRWVPIALEGDDPAISRVSERGDLLYALSTGTATDADGAPRGSTSADGGDTWTTVPLEEAAAPSDEVAWTLSYTMDLASSADRTVALVTAHVGVPYEELFPELRDPEQPNLTVRVGEQGLDLATTADDGTVDEVVRTIPWDELGVTGAVDLAPQRWAYVADGETWTEATPPVTSTSASGGTTDLQPFADGFLVTHTEWDDRGRGSTMALRSADGVAWEQISAPPVGQVLAVGGTLVHVGPADESGRGTSVQRSTDAGATWAPLDLATIDPDLGSVAEEGYAYGSSGPLGIALVVSSGEGPPDTLLFSTDAEGWTTADLSDVAPDGASSAEVLVGRDRIAVLVHTADGQPGSPSRTATLSAVPRRT